MASTHDLRVQLKAAVIADLLGPAGGEAEEVTESNVLGRYIVGLLAPKGQTIVPDEQDDLAVGGDDDSQDGLTDTIAPQMVSIFPSSLGLTFTVDGVATAIQISAAWGAYDRLVSETLKNAEGEPLPVWKRCPMAATSGLVPLQAGAVGPWFSNPENRGVYVRGLCRQSEMGSINCRCCGAGRPGRWPAPRRRPRNRWHPTATSPRRAAATA